ncbi:Gag polyprotein [Operophtera brumata]|uniref:Gag polyprotein n=1 Tax=Operophtera brumata TaxID=104452 RepID=A0A0L7LJ15_OPEBR|nr:Gag polyprotein [Operophtera brumata]
MARPIKYRSLNKSELEYEVTVRGENPTDSLISLREQIISSSSIPLKDDLEQAEVTLNFVETKISQIEVSGDKSGLNRIEAFMNHLYHRLERINTPTVDISFMVPQTSLNPQGIRVLDHSYRNRKSSDCLETFLKKSYVNMLSKSFLMTLSTGSGFNRNPALTWKNIHDLLIKDFGSYDYDYKLLETIRKRTQGETETIIIYVLVMFAMFARLSKKLSENEQLETLLHNSTLHKNG